MTFDPKSSAGSERMPEGAVGLLGRTMLVLKSFSLLKILRLLKRAIVLPTSPTRQDVGVAQEHSKTQGAPRAASSGPRVSQSFPLEVTPVSHMAQESLMPA